MRAKRALAVGLVLVFLACLLIRCLSKQQPFCSTQDCHNNADTTVTINTLQSTLPITIRPERVAERIPVHPPLDGVHVSVKTTKKNHDVRLSLLVLTWFQTVPKDNLYIVTDVWNRNESFYGFKLHSTTCDTKHTHYALSCKSGVEYDLYYSAVDKGAEYSWFCHFDDDIYVNAIALQKLLSSYNHHGYWYLGRWSVNRKTRIPVSERALNEFPHLKRKEYYFATGAAYCVSSALMKEMETYLRGPEKFQSFSRILGTPDDMIVGFVVESLLGHNLTEVPIIHTHLEWLGKITSNNLLNQVSISYGSLGKTPNVINLSDPPIPHNEDRTRFLSCHCLLYPITPWCSRP